MSATERESSTHRPASDSQAPLPKNKRSLSKTHLDYWRLRIKRPFYTRNGIRHEAPNFSVELQHQGRRCNWSLLTPNRDAAAARAKEIYLYLVANGWEASIAKFRPRTIPEPKVNLSIGEYIDQIRRVTSGKGRTLEAYAKSLRKIVSDIFEISRGGGHTRWLEAIHSRPLSELTPARIQTWKLSFIQRAGPDRLAIRTAQNNVNSYLRCAKCLFSRQIIGELKEITLPNPLPFDGVAFEPRPSTKYYSRVNATELIAQARKELTEPHREPWKIFLLGIYCGLRRLEIDLLEWSAFCWDESTLRIEPTKYFHPKTEDSIGSVPIETELLELFRGYRASATGAFVIESDQPPRPNTTYQYYRCKKSFQTLIGWLRTKGVDGFKPLHVLRKEYGSQLCARAGIYAASRGLRHSDISITSQFYTDSQARAVIGLGHLLAEQKIVPLPVPEKKVRKQPNRSRPTN